MMTLILIDKEPGYEFSSTLDELHRGKLDERLASIRSGKIGSRSRKVAFGSIYVLFID